METEDAHPWAPTDVTDDSGTWDAEVQGSQDGLMLVALCRVGC